MTWDRNQSTLENVAAISGDFHTHASYEEFYTVFGRKINGFPGIYEICISMAKALTDWEDAQIRKGSIEPYDEAGLDWIVVVEGLVDRMISDSLIDGFMPQHPGLVRSVIENARAP